MSKTEKVIDILKSQTGLSGKSFGCIGAVGTVGISGTVGVSSGNISSTTNALSNVTYTSPKTTYNVFGKEIEVDGYFSEASTAMSISIINVLGIKAYIEMCKNNIHFPKKISDYLDAEVISYQRDTLINEII